MEKVNRYSKSIDFKKYFYKILWEKKKTTNFLIVFIFLIKVVSKLS